MSQTMSTSVSQVPAPSRFYLPHLVVYVVWHPGNGDGMPLARALFNDLAGDPDDPTSEGVGVPVFYRTGTGGEAVPRAIHLDKARHTAVVVLVDDNMVVDRNDGWGSYVSGLWKTTAQFDGIHRLLPVAMSKRAFNLDPAIQETNCIRFYEADPEKRADQLAIHVTHELCRQVMHESRADHRNSPAAALGDKVEVFISHAKYDGLEIAKAIRDHIRSDQQLGTFFDSNDIYFGKSFRQVIEDGVRRAAMLVVNTDAYSLSEWCRDEVLLAKSQRRPIYTLEATKKKVRRTFPYMYNIPSERHSGKEDFDFRPVVKGLLLEVLRIERFRRQFEENPDLFKIPKGQGISVLPYPPELLTLADLRLAGNADKIFVYPDPPVSVSEQRRLDVFALGLNLTTPVMMLTQAQLQADLNDPASGTAAADASAPTGMSDEQVKGLVAASAKTLDPPPRSAAWTIGISISDQPDAELLRLGLGPEHVSSAAEQFALYFLAAQYRLAYGGDLRKRGFTERLHELVARFNRKNFGPKQILRNYLAWYVKMLTPIDVRAGYAEASEEIGVSPPADLGIGDTTIPPEESSADFPYIRARCLTAMRARMNQDIDARVVLGGESVGYNGTYPGLAEEADLAFRSRKPLYLIGGFGGCARVIIDAFEGKNPLELTENYQERSKSNQGYADFVKAFNARAAASGKDASGKPVVESIDYASLAARFKEYGVEGLSAANGLSTEENETLFATTDVKEMVYLVLKGLLEVRNGDSAGKA
jgi:hypothetical protein